MKSRCEIVSRKVLPHIRAELGKILMKKYNWPQKKVALVLSISQASVSHYLTSTRGNDERLAGLFPEIKNYTMEVAETIAAKEGSDVHLDSEILCHICKQILRDERFEEYLRNEGSDQH